MPHFAYFNMYLSQILFFSKAWNSDTFNNFKVSILRALRSLCQKLIWISILTLKFIYRLESAFIVLGHNKPIWIAILWSFYRKKYTITIWYIWSKKIIEKCVYQRIRNQKTPSKPPHSSTKESIKIFWRKFASQIWPVVKEIVLFTEKIFAKRNSSISSVRLMIEN